MEKILNLIKSKKKKLQNLHYKDVNFFNFNGLCTYAKCVKQCDGDTAVFIFYYKKQLIKYKIRLCGIDTAECKSNNILEVEIANKAKQFMIDNILDKVVFIECFNFDKYQRLLAKIYNNKKKNICYNDLLVKKNLAYIYNGDKRKSFQEWYHIN